MASEIFILNNTGRGTNRATNRLINVLIVDDDINARSRVCNLLGASDVSIVVREAADGLAAIDLIKDNRPDLMVLDLEMPKLDGLGVLLVLRGLPEGSRPCFIAVVSTCISDPAMAKGVRLLGADAAYTKPLLHGDAERILELLVEKPLSAA